MRLDPDCVRDILFVVEETTTLSTPCFINQNYKNISRLKKYDFATLAYHVNQCAMRHYFTSAEFDGNWNCIIRDLTPEAHNFIANIRDNTIWNKVKKKMVELGVSSLEQIPVIAAAVVNAQLLGI